MGTSQVQLHPRSVDNPPTFGRRSIRCPGHCVVVEPEGQGTEPNSSLAVIKVGAATEVELKERKARVEDALSDILLESPVESGIVKINFNEDDQITVEIDEKAIRKPPPSGMASNSETDTATMEAEVIS